MLLWYNIAMEKFKNNITMVAEMVTISRAEYEALQAKLKDTEAELDNTKEKLKDALSQNELLLENLRVNKRKIFGKSSEQMEQMLLEGYSYLFNEPEYLDKDSYKKETKVKGYTRKQRSGSINEVIPDNTPVEVVEHHLAENERICDVCKSEMVVIGKEVHRSLQIEPARFWVREDHYYTYACKTCEKETGETQIKNTPKKAMVLPGSFASASAIAHIAVQKYVMYSPLYRLEQEFERMGLKLSRQTMSNWLLKATENWIEPIYNLMHKELCKQTVIHADETTLQVLKEKDKSSTSKSYMWLYRTSGDAKYPIVLYEYQPNRKAENAEKFLDGFSGWLHADGYQGYHKLPKNIRIVGCFAHARRKFEEALKILPKEQQKTSKPAEALSYIAKLFYLEDKFANLTAEERYIKRLKQEKPVLEALFSWANELKDKTAPKSALGKALNYLLEQRIYLERYLEDGRLELSNNRAERSIKPFVMGRKNWLFANTPAGANSSAMLYSIIETAKENNLNPHKYLLWIFENAPKLAEKDDNWAEKFLPIAAPAECKVPE